MRSLAHDPTKVSTAAAGYGKAGDGDEPALDRRRALLSRHPHQLTRDRDDLLVRRFRLVRKFVHYVRLLVRAERPVADDAGDDGLMSEVLAPGLELLVREFPLVGDPHQRPTQAVRVGVRESRPLE